MTQPLSITVVAGARPNFMTIAPIVRALNPRKTSAMDMVSNDFRGKDGIGVTK